MTAMLSTPELEQAFLAWQRGEIGVEQACRRCGIGRWRFFRMFKDRSDELRKRYEHAVEGGRKHYAKRNLARRDARREAARLEAAKEADRMLQEPMRVRGSAGSISDSFKPDEVAAIEAFCVEYGVMQITHPFPDTDRLAGYWKKRGVALGKAKVDATKIVESVRTQSVR